eukprot:13940616-Heterocapsa_arctica.AAC.2
MCPTMKFTPCYMRRRRYYSMIFGAAMSSISLHFPSVLSSTMRTYSVRVLVKTLVDDGPAGTVTGTIATDSSSDVNELVDAVVLTHIMGVVSAP